MGHVRNSGQGLLTTLLGIVVLVAVGFAVGLVVGVISEEPDLVAGHVAGRSTEVDWTAPVDGESLASAPEAEIERVVVVSDADWGEAAETTTQKLPDVAARPRGQATFAIQVGAFGTESAARSMETRLRRAGYGVRSIPPTTDSRWRVRVGPISGQSEAEEIARRLKVEEGLPTWVLAEKGS
ncbi:SPOR domain-containing protein [Myxococcota bacterium]|nr:SPOR domain-containing protein [Myxococcota bacterium]